MTHALSTLDRLVIDMECRRLSALYCRLVDTYDHDALLNLWTHDAVWTSVKGEMRGHAEIQAYLGAKPRGLSRHVCSNHLIEAETTGTATGSCDFTVHIGAPATALSDRAVFQSLPLIGRYHDVYRLENGAWRFARRRMELLTTPAA